MDHSPTLVLASASPRRRLLLAELGLDPEVVPPSSVSEREQDEDLSPCELVEYNARLKAGVVARHHPAALVIAADTLVFLDGAALPKPRDLTQARQFLMRLSGRTHEVFTGVCLAGPGSGRLHLFHERTSVTFRPVGAREIAVYLDLVDVRDKAGGYALQDHGEILIERVEGSQSNVIGLPLERLERELLALGRSDLLPNGIRR